MVNKENTSNANLNSIQQIPYFITCNYPTHKLSINREMPMGVIIISGVGWSIIHHSLFFGLNEKHLLLLPW